jgi:hypothetical protein
MIHPRQLPLVDLMLIAQAELRSNHGIRSYEVTEDEWLTFRRCSSCKLDAEIETVSPSYRQVSNYDNGVRHSIVERAAPRTRFARLVANSSATSRIPRSQCATRRHQSSAYGAAQSSNRS